MRLRDTRHHTLTPLSADGCDLRPHGSSFNIASSDFCLELCHPVLLPQITFQCWASSFSVPLPSDGECEKERLCLLHLRGFIVPTVSFHDPPVTMVRFPDRGLVHAEVLWLTYSVKSPEVTPKTKRRALNK